jgi:hypothetical protein
MKRETPECELSRLRKEQSDNRVEEVFGGFSRTERAAYDRKEERIRELESEVQASAVAKKHSQSAKAEKRLGWIKPSETDSPQSEPHGRYATKRPTVAKRFRNSATTNSMSSFWTFKCL